MCSTESNSSFVLQTSPWSKSFEHIGTGVRVREGLWISERKKKSHPVVAPRSSGRGRPKSCNMLVSVAVTFLQLVEASHTEGKYREVKDIFQQTVKDYRVCRLQRSWTSEVWTVVGMGVFPVSGLLPFRDLWWGNNPFHKWKGEQQKGWGPVELDLEFMWNLCFD